LEVHKDETLKEAITLAHKVRGRNLLTVIYLTALFTLISYLLFLVLTRLKET